jgi:hypothetical protein
VEGKILQREKENDGVENEETFFECDAAGG